MLMTIIARILVNHKWLSYFLNGVFELIYSIQGCLIFENLTRYSHMNERMFRRNYKKLFLY